ncbi:hypothetical protein [Pseudolysinimonas kribbensis]|uniref:hypothetical protein n=1 Tax=Pseudolysinimonas kribbensis TaxID=433641 RepID=UPI0024E174F5|nr:hypothetical protein [Pseudolysinimonas kribbensis]
MTTIDRSALAAFSLPEPVVAGASFASGAPWPAAPESEVPVEPAPAPAEQPPRARAAASATPTRSAERLMGSP